VEDLLYSNPVFRDANGNMFQKYLHGNAGFTGNYFYNDRNAHIRFKKTILSSSGDDI
jgi:hypothetical protein